MKKSSTSSPCVDHSEKAGSASVSNAALPTSTPEKLFQAGREISAEVESHKNCDIAALKETLEKMSKVYVEEWLLDTATSGHVTNKPLRESDSKKVEVKTAAGVTKSDGTGTQIAATG